MSVIDQGNSTVAKGEVRCVSCGVRKQLSDIELPKGYNPTFVDGYYRCITCFEIDELYNTLAKDSRKWENRCREQKEYREQIVANWQEIESRLKSCIERKDAQILTLNDDCREAQDRVEELERAYILLSNAHVDVTGSCPFDSLGVPYKNDLVECDKHCQENDSPTADCYRWYYMKQAEHKGGDDGKA